MARKNTSKPKSDKERAKIMKKTLNDTKDVMDRLRSMTSEEANSALQFIDNFKNADIDKIKNDAIEKIDSMNISDDITVKDILYEEFELWDIKITSRVKAFIDFMCDTVIKDKLNSRPSYDDVIKLVDRDDRITASAFTNLLKEIVKNAQFINTKYFPSLSRIRRADITPILLLNQIIDYTYDETE